MNLNIIKNKVKGYLFRNLNFTAKSIGIMVIAISIVNLIKFLYNIVMGKMLGSSEYGVLISITFYFA